MSEKPATKLNRLYKKWEKAEDKDKVKVEDEIKKVCEEQNIDYTMTMDYLKGDPTTVALIQSITMSWPVVEKIKKEDTEHGNSKAKPKERRNPCNPNQ